VPEADDVIDSCDKDTCPLLQQHLDADLVDAPERAKLYDRLRAVEISTAKLEVALETLTSINAAVEKLVRSDDARNTKEKIAVWVGNAILMGIAYIIGLVIQQFIGSMK
jgi:hypothetical protein